MRVPARFRQTMRTLLSLSLLVVATSALASPRGAAVDPEAMGEALQGSRVAPTPYASSRAYEHYLSARIAEHLGDLTAAREQLELALIYDEGAVDLRLAFAWILARTDDIPRSVKEVQRIVRTDPNHAGGWLLLGKIRAAQRRKTEALEALRRAASLDPSDIEAHLTQVRLHADFGEYEMAEAIATRLETVRPGDGTAWRLLARVVLERRQTAAARKYLARAIRTDRDDVASRLRLAEIHEREGRHEKAARLYQEVLAADPTHSTALLSVARAALRRGDPSGARAYFDQLLGTARDPVKATLDVVTSWRADRNHEEALVVLDQSLAVQADPRLLLAKGMLLSSEGRHAEAEATFARVPETAGPIHVVALTRRAESLSLAGRHEAALQVLEQAFQGLKARLEWEEWADVVPDVYRRAGRSADAIELLEPQAAARPGDPALILALGKTLLDAGRTSQALALLSAELVRAPGETRLVFALAAARERAGDPEGAVALMQALLRADPDNASALNFVGYVWADRGERLDEACAMVEKALALVPDEAHFLDSLGWCEFKRGNVERAISLLERATALAPREPVLLHHLAEAYGAAGRPHEAWRRWRKALEILDRDPDPRVMAEIREAMGRRHHEISGLRR